MGRPKNNKPYIARTFAIDVKTLIRLDRECKKLKTNRSRFLSGVLEGYLAFLDKKCDSPIPDPDSLLPRNRRPKPDVPNDAS
ncbi:MAG: hypothetical protein AABP62_10405 [Planctomycetota bacterium]